MALHWSSADHQLYVVDDHSQIFVWHIPQTVHERYTLLKAEGAWPLTATGLMLEGTVLSSQNHSLLQQLGATGKPIVYGEQLVPSKEKESTRERISKFAFWQKKKGKKLASVDKKKVSKEPSDMVSPIESLPKPVPIALPTQTTNTTVASKPRTVWQAGAMKNAGTKSSPYREGPSIPARPTREVSSEASKVQGGFAFWRNKKEKEAQPIGTVNSSGGK